MHLVVMAAGRGTRMGPLSAGRSKVLLPVAGRPLIEHLLLHAREAGFREATLIVHHDAQGVRDLVGDGSRIGLAADYVDQVEPKGTGHAVASLDGRVGDAFVLVSGDSWLGPKDLKALRAAKGLAVAGRHVDDVRPFGHLHVQGGAVTKIMEKPTTAAPGEVSAGAYRLDASVVEAARVLKPSPRGEIELPDALMRRAADGETLRYVETKSWIEAGRPWDLLRIQAEAMQGLKSRHDGEVGRRVDIEGPVVVGAGARVLNGTRIEGPVIVGADAVVGPNAYLRSATAIGQGCHVGGSVEVKNSILMGRANLPHLSYVGDSIIGERVNLGAGTQIANLKVTPTNVAVRWSDGARIDTGLRKFGAVIGDDVKTGVNSSINPGTIIGNGALIGAGVAVDGWIADGARIIG